MLAKSEMLHPGEIRAAYRRNLAILEGADDAVDLELSVHIGLLLFEVRRSVNGRRRHDCWWGLNQAIGRAANSSSSENGGGLMWSVWVGYQNIEFVNFLGGITFPQKHSAGDGNKILQKEKNFETAGRGTWETNVLYRRCWPCPRHEQWLSFAGVAARTRPGPGRQGV